MPDFRIDSIYDVAALEAEKEQFLAILQESKAGILDVNSQRITLKSADVSGFTQATTQLNDAINQSTAATTKATTANQQLTKTQIEARLANQQRTAAIKDEIISNNAAAGSYVQLQQQLKTLTAQYKALSETERNSSVGKQLQLDIASTNAQLKILDAGLGNFQRNVGNYNNSLGLLSRGVKGLGGIGILLSKALGIDPEIATGIEEVGRAIRDLQHIRESEEIGLKAEGELYEQTAIKMDATSAALDGETVSTEAATGAQGELTTSLGAAGVAQDELAVQTEIAGTALGAEAGAAEAATVATTSFGTTLAATGIGAAIIAIAIGIAKLVEVVKDYNAGVLSQIEADKALKVMLGELVSSTKEYETLRTAAAEAEIKDLQQRIDLQKAAGITGLQSLALDKQSAQAQLDLANSQAKRYDITKQTLQASLKDAQDATNFLRIEEQKKQEFLQKTAEVKDKDYAADLKRYDDNIAQYQKQAEGLKAAFDFANEIYTKQSVSQGKIDLANNQAAKLSADERRNLILVEATTEADITINKNKIILADERSTLDERLAAIKSNAAQQLAIINATLQNTLNDPTKDETEKNIARAKASADRIKLTDDTEKQDFDIKDAYRKKELKAENDYANASITREKEISANKLTDRFTDLEANLSIISQSGREENAILTNNYELTKATTVLSENELLAITENYNNAILKNNIDTDNKLVAAQQKAVDEQVAALKYLHDQKLAIQNEKSDISTNTKATDLINQAVVDEAGKSADTRAKIESTLQKNLSVIDKQGQLERLAIADADLQDNLEKATLLDQDTTDIQEKITENQKKEAELRKGIVDEEYKYKKAINDKEAQEAEERINTLLDLGQTFGDADFQRQKDQVQKQEDLNDAKEQRDIDAVNATAATAQEKADEITIIQARADSEKQALDIKQRKNDYEKAKFDKGIAILETVANIAIQYAKGDFIAAGLAAVALVKLIATPIPAYKGGRGTGKKELARVGDGGVNEYIYRAATGSYEMTPAVDTLTHLMPDDKVFSNKQALMKELALSGMPLSNYRVNSKGGIDKADMKRFTSEIVEAVSDIKIHTQLITKDGWRNHNERLAKYDQWVTKYIKN